MIFLQHLLPHHQVNKLAKLIGTCSIPWFKNLLINHFLKSYPVNLTEALSPDPLSYKNYNDFFTRKLQPTARIIDPSPNAIISPCDGYVTEYGTIDPEILIKAKKASFSLAGLLGNSSEVNLENFINGKFINIYLAPHNYHRVHMPFTGSLTNMLYIPGKLFSVKPNITNKIPNIFSNNERVINIFNTEIGKIVIVLVGAMIVGSIVTSWHGEVNTKHNNPKIWSYQNHNLSRGEELGYFQLGSTVIMLLENKKLQFSANLVNNVDIQMGKEIFTIT